jgi:type VI secretion system protein VasI
MVAVPAWADDIQSSVMVCGEKFMLKAVALGLALLLAATAPAVAQQRGSACAAIDSDEERLACYDGIFRSAGAEGPAEAVTLQSQRLIPAQPSGRQPATLTIACEAGAVAVNFAFAGQLVSVTGDIAPLTLQVDQNATAARTLTAAPDNQSLSFSSARDTEAFLDSLAGGTSLRVRVTPVRQRSLTVDFRIDAAIEPIAALRESCQPASAG